MKSSIRRFSLLAVGMILAVLLVAPKAVRSDGMTEWNRITYFTVNQPFEVPGVVLAPNTKYVIRMLDVIGQRHTVQIFNGDQTKCLTTFLAASDYRLEPTGKTVFTFAETAPGFPKVVKGWFYPGNLTGLEFIYPMSQAKRIAEHAKEPILATSDNISPTMSNMGSVKVEAVNPVPGDALSRK